MIKKLIIITFLILSKPKFNENLYIYDTSYFKNNYNELFINHFKLIDKKPYFEELYNLIENDKSTYNNEYFTSYDFLNNNFKYNKNNKKLKSQFIKFYSKFFIYYNINSKKMDQLLYKFELNYKYKNKIKNNINSKFEFKIENHMKIIYVIWFNIINLLVFLFKLVEDIEEYEK